MCVCVLCVRACVRVCVVRACVRACVRARVCVLGIFFNYNTLTSFDMLFSAYELWFKQILFEIDSVRNLFSQTVSSFTLDPLVHNCFSMWLKV